MRVSDKERREIKCKAGGQVACGSGQNNVMAMDNYFRVSHGHELEH